MNTALALWLFLSSLWIISTAAAPRWNDVIVAAVVFVLSFVPSELPDDVPGTSPQRR